MVQKQNKRSIWSFSRSRTLIYHQISRWKSYQNRYHIKEIASYLHQTSRKTKFGSLRNTNYIMDRSKTNNNPQHEYYCHSKFSHSIVKIMNCNQIQAKGPQSWDIRQGPLLHKIKAKRCYLGSIKSKKNEPGSEASMAKLLQIEFFRSNIPGFYWTFNDTIPPKSSTHLTAKRMNWIWCFKKQTIIKMSI